MTTPDREGSVLLVEGQDDKHAIYHLLERAQYQRPGNVAGEKTLVQVNAVNGKDSLLNLVGLTVRSGTGKSVGFVFDANSRPVDRWRSIASRLHDVGVDAPGRIPANGFVGKSHDFNTRVGVWLMPDNRRTGALERFLIDLVEPDDQLLQYAGTATDKAKALGAQFSENDGQKALVHTWLAWQKKPGLRYGTAISARYFRHDAPIAAIFVDWYRQLYDVE